MSLARFFTALIFVSAVGTSTLNAQGFTARSGDFGISANLWLSGNIALHAWGTDVTKNTAPLVHIFYDAYLMDKLSMGLFINYSPASIGTASIGVTMIDIGFSIKPRFLVANGEVAIKPGINIGYRTGASESGNMDAMDAMALNGSVEIQFSPDAQLMPFIEIGFITQPVGGNDITGVSWAPIFYVGGGVVF